VAQEDALLCFLTRALIITRILKAKTMMKPTISRLLLLACLAASAGAEAQTRQGDVADQFFRFAESKNKKTDTPLPSISIDRFTGTARITQEDMMLPGVAGLDLHLVRTYSSKIWGRAELDALNNMIAINDPMPSMGLGWSLHMGRLRSPQATGQPGACGASDAPIYEAPDGNARTFYKYANLKFISRDFWKLDQACILSSGATGVCVISPAGQTIEFATPDYLLPNAAAVYRFATKIRDLFGNSISITYNRNRIDQITDSVGRVIKFNYMACAAGTASTNGGQCITSIDANAGARTVSYSHTTLNGPPSAGSIALQSPGWAFLTTVTTSANTTFTYDYNTAGLVVENEYALKSMTYPSGGTVAFTYAARQYQTASSVGVPFAVVVSQTVSGTNLETSTTTYDYVSDSAAGTLTSTATMPDGAKNTQVFRSFGSGTTSGNIWRVGLLVSETIAPSGNPANILQSTTYQWDPGPIVSSSVQYAGPQYDARVGCVTDSATTSPRMTSRTTARGGNVYTTNYSNPDDYGQPRTTTEVGEKGRTTTATYSSVPATNQVLGRVTSEFTCYTGAAAATCSTTTRTFNGPYNSLDTETERGVVTSYTYEIDDVHALGTIKQITNANGNKLVMSNFIQGLPQSVDFDGAYSWSRTYNWDGSLATQTDGRLNTTSYLYDAAGRIKTETPPTGNDSVTHTYPTPNSYTVTRGTGTSSLTESYQLDGLGRTIAVTNDVGEKHLTDYDVLGRIAFESDPLLTSSTETGQKFTRDLLGRVVLTENRFRSTGHRPLVGACADVASCRVTTEFPDVTNSAAPKGHCVRLTVARAASDQPVTTSCFESFGNPDDERLAKVTDARSKVWTYAYDILGNLTTFNAPSVAGNRSEAYAPTTFFHSSSTNGPQGAISRTPNGINQLKTETDARTGGVTTFEYGTTATRSPLSRLTRTLYALTPGDDTSYSYDKETRKTVSSTNGGTYTYAYDSVGRLQSQTWVFLGIPYVTTWSYNSSGCLTSVKYPSGSTVTALACDRKARPTALNVNGSPLASAISYMATGKPTSITLANGAVSTYQSVDGRIQKIAVAKGATKFVDLTYSYDGASNVKSVTDSLVASSSVSSTAYDALDRLTNVTIGSAPYTYAYDDLGNRTAKTGPLGTTTFAYDPTTNRLRDSTGPAVPAPMALTWNARSELVATSEGTVYTWDGLGRRVRKTNAGLGVDVVYHYDANGTLIAETTTSGARLREYFYIADQLLAVDGCISGFSVPCTDREFVHTDAVGSVVARTSSSGAPTTAIRYQPWGESSSGSWLLGFNGRVLDSTGFYDFGARAFSPELGRFISADSVFDFSAGPQASNSYSFAYNNPYKFTDKTGHCPMCIGAAFGAITGGYIAYGEALFQGKSGQALVEATIIGAGTGGILGTGVGALAEGAAIAIGVVGGGVAARASATLNAAAQFKLDAQLAGSIRNVNAIGAPRNCVACAIATDRTLGGAPASALGGVEYPIGSIRQWLPGGRWLTFPNFNEIARTMSNFGAGSRGIVHYRIPGFDSGHVMNVANQSGVVRFLDGQSGGSALLPPNAIDVMLYTGYNR
jgi:RHS repeat-associated protein